MTVGNNRRPRALNHHQHLAFRQEQACLSLTLFDEQTLPSMHSQIRTKGRIT